MKIPKFPLSFVRRRLSRCASPRPAFVRKLGLLTLLAGAAALPLTVEAGLISTVTLGPDTAPYAYNLTVEFANSDCYNFVLRSTATSLTGETLINTVAADPAAHLTVEQQFFSGLGSFVNGITAGTDAASGYNATTGQFWAYWNGTATTPVQWTSPQDYGESGRTLTPGQADGWVYSTGANAPQATGFTVPEPGAWAWLGAAAVGSGVFRLVRRRRPGSAQTLV